MTKPMVVNHNVETNNIVEREMNTEELAIWETEKESYTQEQERLNNEKAAKNALLERLGITAEEAKLLLS